MTRQVRALQRLLTTATILLLLLSPSAFVLAAAQEPASPDPDLTEAVQAAAATATGSPNSAAIVVSAITATRDWAYGTAGVPAANDGETPTGLIFLATRAGGGGNWQVAFRYTPAFDELLAQVPDGLLAPEVQDSLTGFHAAGDGSAQLSLPWEAGRTWYFSGPHPDIGSNVWSALDFYEANQSGQARAARGGIAYRPCTNMVLIDHGDGWATGYYHLVNIAVSNGQAVSRGQVIGTTSQQVGCGGFATGPHVHFWTERNGSVMAIAGQEIGGWTVENGDEPYDGCLVKGSVRKCLDQSQGIYNNDIYNDGTVGSGPAPHPAVAVSPTRGTVNTWVNYQLSGFPAGTAVTIQWRRTSGSLMSLGSVHVNSSGARSGRIRVPATPGGDNQQIRFSTGLLRATAYYDVAPRIKAIPSSAARGQTINISLRGFGKKETVRIRWQRGASWVELTRVVTSNTGSANVDIRVPSWAPDGRTSIRGDGTSFRAQTNAFTVTGGAFQPAAASPTTRPPASPAPSPTITEEPTMIPEATATPPPTATATVPPTEPPIASPAPEGDPFGTPTD
ncbi:MAG TPA: M23 family metallopeptidase [Thermomicrobiales bacterium]|nr:M23 family metallopeptidase [Thermomicrobiales bacterium]